MEIDKAIRECDDGRLRTKYYNSIYVIQRALFLYSIEELAFSFNGGKDSTVLLHLLRAGYFLHKEGQNSPDGSLKDFPIRTIYFETPCAFPEINSFTHDTAAIDVWAFLLTCKVQYCCLYDQGYTSIGSIHDTVPNALLSIGNSSNEFKPAYMLSDGALERAGRPKKSSIWRQISANSNGSNSLDLHRTSLLTASVIVVGDEILFGTVEDQLGPSLCRKLHSVGWSVSQVSVVQSNIDSVAEEVERQKSTCDMVTICGGVGPLHSDVTLAGVAKAFGVRLAPDENFEEYLRHNIGDQCNGDWNKMAQLPEGITELLHHDKLSMPLIRCQNVVVLCATNALELEEEWDCLLELTKSSDLFELLKAYVSKNVTTNLSDVEIAQPLTKLCLQYPDLYIGCYRKSRYGSLVASFIGKDQARIESAVRASYKKFGSDAFMDMG